MSGAHLGQDSPFYADSERRQRYVDFTGYHPSSSSFPLLYARFTLTPCAIVKVKELEDLAEAVRTENHRLYALQEQRK